MKKTQGQQIYYLGCILWLLIGLTAVAQDSGSSQYGKFTIARIHYDGGGDWYSDPSSLPNLLEFLEEQDLARCQREEARVRITDKEFFSYPYLYITGHGNIRFSEEEILRLRKHLQSGGFLHADDNYGMDKSFRREIRRIFPDNELVQLPFDHPIYHIVYSFPEGLPKVHEHDGKAPQGLGIFYHGRLVVFYSYECDLGDGWEDMEVHGDSPEIHRRALEMGANIVTYSLIQ